MQKKYVKRVFDSLCRTLPNAEIVITDRAGQDVFSYPVNEGINFRINSITDKNGMFFDEKTKSCRLKLPISKDRMLLLHVSAGTEETSAVFSRMANNIIDLVKEQETLANSISLSQDKITSLVNRLFNSTTPESIAYVALWGIDLGYDLTLPRAVCILNIKACDSHTPFNENIFRSILYTVKTFTNSSPQDIVAQLNPHQIVLCKAISSQGIPLQKQLNPYLSSICAYLATQYKSSVSIGVGHVPKTIGEYGASLLEAQTALQYARIFGTNQHISFISDYALELEVSKIPTEELEHFLGKYLKILASSSQLLETVEALIKNNMDINSTARHLFIHRNTAVFRINQIKKLFGLNPLHNDSDRFTLIILYIYYKLTHQ